MYVGTLPAKSTHLLQAETDANVGVNPARAKYLAVMAAVPGILAAMDYANLAQIYRDAIWASVDDYAADTPTAVADPSDMPGGVNYDPDNAAFPPYQYIDSDHNSYQKSVDLTQQEAADSFGAKVAHAIHHEKEQTFAWRLYEFSDEDLRGLFDPTFLFMTGGANTSWDPTGVAVPGAWAQHSRSTIDHCPNDTYSIAAPIVAGEKTAKSALATLHEGLMFYIRHGVVITDPYWAIRVHDLLDPARKPWRARSGCHAMARIAAALSRSVNLPCVVDYGWYDQAHASMHWPWADVMWPHADHLYLGGRTKERALAQMVSYSDFVANVVPHGRTNDASAYEMGRLRTLKLADVMSGTAGYAVLQDGDVEPTHGWFWFRAYYVDWYLDLPAEQNTLDAIKAKLDEFLGFTMPDVVSGDNIGDLTVDVVDPGLYYDIDGWPDGTRRRTGDFGPAKTRAETYTVTWPDIYVGNDPPAPQVEVLTDGGSVTFGPPTYVPE